VTALPEPNVDALVKHIQPVFAISPDRQQLTTYLRDLAALARANSVRDQLLRDAMDWIDGVGGMKDGEDLLARFRVLTADRDTTRSRT